MFLKTCSLLVFPTKMSAPGGAEIAVCLFTAAAPHSRCSGNDCRVNE